MSNIEHSKSADCRHTGIKPRIDGGGVPWCDAGCPQIHHVPSVGDFCLIDGYGHNREVCPHAVRRMAVALKALKDGNLYYNSEDSEELTLDIPSGLYEFNTIEAAIDALMGEE